MDFGTRQAEPVNFLAFKLPKALLEQASRPGFENLNLCGEKTWKVCYFCSLYCFVAHTGTQIGCLLTSTHTSTRAHTDSRTRSPHPAVLHAVAEHRLGIEPAQREFPPHRGAARAAARANSSKSSARISSEMRLSTVEVCTGPM